METIEILSKKKGFIAALDQSGGSSKKTLGLYGIGEELITSDEVMFDLIHDMRSRIIKSPVFDERIIGAILFKDTMRRDIDGVNTVKYLSNKGILSFLKIDVGLEEDDSGVQLLKDIPDLDDALKEAKAYGVIGTKMRSVIHEYNEYAIKKLVEQQFKYAKIIASYGLIPIIEPEVSIDAKNKKQIETFLRTEVMKQLNKMNKEEYVMFKFTLPDTPNYYNEILRFKNVLRVVALSGGYDRSTACEKLQSNKKMVASFSRALLEGLNVNQTEDEFNNVLNSSIEEIYTSSVKKV